MYKNLWKPALIALAVLLIAWCFFLILHSGSVLGGFVLVLLSMGMLLMSKQSFDSSDRSELSPAQAAPLAAL